VNWLPVFRSRLLIGPVFTMGLGFLNGFDGPPLLRPSRFLVLLMSPLFEDSLRMERRCLGSAGDVLRGIWLLVP